MGISASSSVSVRVCLGGLVGGAPGGDWHRPDAIIVDRVTAMPAQALHAIEHTELQIRGLEFHWPSLSLRLAGCGSIKASPAAHQQPPPHSAFV